MACEVHVVGQIGTATFLAPGSHAAFCRFRVETGAGWTLLAGAAAGQTQAALASELPEAAGAAAAVGGAAAVWEHPLDVHYSSATLTGWPQLLLTLWRQDAAGRNEVCGYGGVRVPPCPGLHLLEVACWRPEGSALQELCASFLGGGLPHLTDTTMVAYPEAGRRHAIVTETAAVVSVELNVVCRGFAQRGVVFSEVG